MSTRAPTPSAAERLHALTALLADVEDVLAHRVTAPEPPGWATRRGWASFLAALSDDALVACERRGPAAVLPTLPGVPAELRELAERVTARSALPAGEPAERVPALRQASPRKRAQVAALAALVRRWAPRTERIVDLGAGKGHLTRALAEALDLPAIGVERRDAVVRRARDLTFDARVRFVAGDAARDVAPGPSDLLVGLHACGALGDALVERAARTGAGALLVSCCPQKAPGGVRAPRSSVGRTLGLTLDAPLLGLANLATVADGAPDAAAVMDRRRTRRALYTLLRDAGADLAPGDEARGIHRRQFRRPLAELAPRAFAGRGLAAPSPAAIRDAERRAAVEHGRIRRFALPRTMLARPLELALVFDRAAALAETGPAPHVLEAFDRRASPRNVAILRGVGDGDAS
ncbi:MAG TPA: methyltransferase [Sandaracinaceae bacterium LLY-WYZ-13_1]|nr:methyltransferase [Sandaracinaceae bacterium LLY-WYZ-13_1]